MACEVSNDSGLTRSYSAEFSVVGPTWRGHPHTRPLPERRLCRFGRASGWHLASGRRAAGGQLAGSWQKETEPVYLIRPAEKKKVQYTTTAAPGKPTSQRTPNALIKATGARIKVN